MSRPVTGEKDAVIAYVERWRKVAEYERIEARRTPPSTKLLQVAALMQSAALFRDADDDDPLVWARWQRLRAAEDRA